MKKILLKTRCYAIFGSLLVLTGCVKDPPLQAGFYDTIDAFQKELANRASQKITNGEAAKDFRIVVTQSVDPIGTIYRVNTSIPVSENACRPQHEPTPHEAPGLFPGSYSLSKSLAIELGLDEAVFKGLATLGANVSESDTLGLGIKETNRQVLDDESIRALIEQSNCHAVLNGKTVWVVRGYISGFRDFPVKGDADIKFEGKITKIGNFKIEPIKDSRTITVKDEKQQSFLQIVSEISVQSQATAIKSISPPPVSNGGAGIVYIQIDKSDASTNGGDLFKELKQSSINVASGIERIQSTRMPKVTQIRYFNDEDKDKAVRIQTILKRTRPDTALVRLGLPAPKGQLEIWLTKN